MNDPPTDQLEGRNIVLESLRAGRPLGRLRIDERARDCPKLMEILWIAARRDIAVSRVPRLRLDELSLTGAHNGIIAEAPPLPPAKLVDVLRVVQGQAAPRPPLFLIIAGWQDDGDLGAVLRTADAVGVDAVVLPPGVGPSLSATARRVSMGGSEHLSLVREPIPAALEVLRGAGVRVVAVAGAEADAAELLGGSDLRGPVAFVIDGRGGESVLRVFGERCDDVIRVRPERAGSRLPLSALASILLYERDRQLRAAP